MLRQFSRGLVILLTLMVITSLINIFFGTPFGTTDYFDRHGIILLAGLTIFPRLTLLFSSIPSGGFFWWVGWLFAPRLLIAMLATMSYVKTNPVLVTLAWMIALGGEWIEKRTIGNRSMVFHFGHFQRQKHPSKAKKSFDDNVVETTATIKNEDDLKLN